MLFSTDVVLPLDQPPRFPPQCAVCGEAEPASAVVVSSRGIWESGGNLFKLVRNWRREALRISVPACEACVRRFGSRRRRLILLRVVAVLVAAVLIAAGERQLGLGGWLEPLREHLRIVAAIVFVVIFLGPIESVFALPFAVAIQDDGVRYEFRDQERAEAFAALNHAAIDA